jgi:N-acetylglucosamine kinase-like BadF-type ATPase
MTHSNLVLGIDGGGTKTVAWLAPLHKPDAQARGETDLLADGGPSPALRDCDPLGRGTAGPGNPRAVGFEAAQVNIDTAIGAAFAAAGLARAPVAAACFGLAGCGRAEEQDRMAAWARQRRIADRVLVCGDAEPILAAASPENWGIALISGTGSLAWGRNREGQVARCGGWGYLLGDEGSGYAIALAALRAVVRAADSRSPATALSPALQSKLGAANPAELVSRVYAAEMNPKRLAALASVVFDLSDRDRTAASIVSAAAGDLSWLIESLADELRLPAGQYPLAMAGGVLLNQPSFRELVLKRVGMHRVPGSVTCVSEPAAGAVRLARRLADEARGGGTV